MEAEVDSVTIPIENANDNRVNVAHNWSSFNSNYECGSSVFKSTLQQYCKFTSHCIKGKSLLYQQWSLLIGRYEICIITEDNVPKRWLHSESEYSSNSNNSNYYYYYDTITFLITVIKWKKKLTLLLVSDIWLSPVEIFKISLWKRSKGITIFLIHFHIRMYTGHSMPNRTLLHFCIKEFFRIFFISRVQASIEKIKEKKTWKSSFLAKLRSLKVAKFARLPLDMHIFVDLLFSSFLNRIHLFLAY